MLQAFRRSIRSLDVYSSRLAASYFVTSPQLSCLSYIANHKAVTPSQLCVQMYLSPSTINGIIDRLEIKGLVVRERSDPDRRKVQLYATKAGESLAERTPALLQQRLAESIKHLPENERTNIADVMEQLAGILESLIALKAVPLPVIEKDCLEVIP